MSEQVGKIFTRQDVADALQDAFLRFDTCTSADPDQYSFTIEGRHLMIDFIFEHYGIPTDISELEAGQRAVSIASLRAVIRYGVARSAGNGGGSTYPMATSGSR